MKINLKQVFGFNFYDVLAVLFCSGFALACFYPMWYVFLGSINVSDTTGMQQSFVLIPQSVPSFRYYILIIKGREFFNAISISVSKTVISTVLSLVITSMMAYATSKEKVKGMRFFNFIVVFTMFFSGGLIPSFLLVQSLGIYDKYAALILPGLILAANYIIMRNYFSFSVPKELEDACVIDGANEIVVYFKIVVPISKPMLAALSLFIAVANWNDWYTYLIYARKPELRPFVEVLRKILVNPNAFLKEMSGTSGMGVGFEFMPPAALKMTTIMIATLPILMLYPFLQRHFAKGIMIGALKE